MEKKQNIIGDNQLLTREEFKKYGFQRTNGKCCIPFCDCDAVDAHHIMDRKLWPDGGYYLSNCAPVCEKHHIDCEKGRITPVELMHYCNIDVDEILQPDKIDWLNRTDYLLFIKLNMIDKWGN